MSDSMSRTPRKGKIVNLRIKFLDDSVHAFQVHIKAVGHELWEAVIRHLQLVESDYFDLQYEDLHNIKCWLDHEKAIMKQLPTPDSPLEFCVKFYTPDPGLLDEFTRYLFALQIKKDLACGAMTCSENTAALIASYIAQAEIGDYIIEEYTDHTYLLQLSAFVPNQTEELLKKVMEYHKQHIGENPEEAESNLLDTARKVDTYGIKLHEAKDHEGTPLHLATAHMGILVFQHQTKINTFSWAKIRKLSFKRKKFLIKLHPDTYGYYKDTVEFFFESRDESKVFWKKCIEHHAFFRCQTSRKLPRNKTKIVSRGSSFRYSGRTQKELMKYVRETPVKSPSFERSVSGRISTASRSASVTPKIPVKLNLHNSTTDTHNSTASSGSHILSPGPQAESPRVETADVHSAGDSSVSGSQSIGSPKLDRTQSVESPQGDGINITLDEGEEQQEQEAEEQEADERGSTHYSFVTNALVSAHNNITNMSANQNANDNDDNQSQASYHLDEEKDEVKVIDDTNDKIDFESKAEVNAGETINEAKTPEKEQHSKTYSTSSLGRESKKVAFADDVKNGVKDDNDDKSIIKSVIYDNIGVIEGGDLQPDISSGSLNVSQTKEVPVSTGASDNVVTNTTNQFDLSQTANQNEPVCSLANQNGFDKDVGPAGAAGEEHVQKNDLHPDGIPESNNNSEKVSSGLTNQNEDLFEDIPYYLHRRSNGDDQTELYTAVVDALNGKDEVESGQDVSQRRSRSLKKKRPSNMQVQQIKVYDGGPSPSSDHSPTDSLRFRRSFASDKSSSRSPSEKRFPFQSRSPSGKRTPDGMSPSRSSLERSPSCNRRVEVVNYHKLPPKNSFSSVDDTTSPTFEKDILKQIQGRSSPAKDYDNVFAETVPVLEDTSQVNKTCEKEKIDKSSDKSSEIDLENNESQSVNQIPSSDNICKLDDLDNDRKCIQDNIMNDMKNEIEKISDEKSPVCMDISSSNVNPDIPSAAAAFILSDADYKKQSSNNITFSTFKPADGHSDKVQTNISSPSEINYSSSTTLPSTKDSHDSDERVYSLLPTGRSESVFQQPSSPHTCKTLPSPSGLSSVAASRKHSVFSQKTGLGYKYSFENIHETPCLSLAEQDESSLDIDPTVSHVSESPDSVDMLEALEKLNNNSDDGSEIDDSISDHFSGDESGSERESDSSDEDTYRHHQFLQFAKSLADSGKETGIDSKTNIMNKVSHSSVDNNQNHSVEDENQNYPNSSQNFPQDQNIDNDYLSSSSDDVETEKILRNKRVSVDPLENLENPNIAEIATSASDDSFCDEEEIGQKRENGGQNIPVLNMNTASNQDMNRKI